MNIFKRRLSLLIVTFYFLASALNTLGIGKETIVLSGPRAIPIYHFDQIGQAWSFNCKTQEFEQQSLKEFHLKQVDSSLHIFCDAIDFYSDFDHLFLLHETGEWKKAEDLVVGDQLFSANGPIAITDIKRDNKPRFLYDLSVESNNTFLITQQGIVVHNIAPAVGVAISFVFGEGGIALKGVTAFFSFFGFALGFDALCNDKDKKIKPTFEVTPQAVGHVLDAMTGGPGPEKDPDKDKKEEEKKKKKGWFWWWGKKKKTEEEIIKEARFTNETTSTKNRVKKGKYDNAHEDFSHLELKNKRSMPNGKGEIGDLPDGRVVNVRKESKTGPPTLEIYDPKTKKSIKIRYED